MIERRLGQAVTLETRGESSANVDRIKRQSQVLEILSDLGPMTAKEIAVEMLRRGYSMNDDRNNAAPRLTEMLKTGQVEALGKERCIYTGKTVTVFARRRVDQQQSFLN